MIIRASYNPILLDENGNLIPINERVKYFNWWNRNKYWAKPALIGAGVAGLGAAGAIYGKRVSQRFRDNKADIEASKTKSAEIEKRKKGELDTYNDKQAKLKAEYDTANSKLDQEARDEKGNRAKIWKQILGLIKKDSEPTSDTSAEKTEPVSKEEDTSHNLVDTIRKGNPKVLDSEKPHGSYRHFG